MKDSAQIIELQTRYTWKYDVDNAAAFCDMRDLQIVANITDDHNAWAALFVNVVCFVFVLALFCL